MRRAGYRYGFWVALAISALIASVPSGAATVLFEGRTVEVERTLSDPNDLWVTPEDLTHINGFELKPEGACLAEICIPIRPDQDSDLAVTRDGQRWVNVTELARKLGQGFATDGESGVWSFAEIPVVRSTELQSAIAPDFALTDRTGKLVHLSDYRGRKVLLKTWASW